MIASAIRAASSRLPYRASPGGDERVVVGPDGAVVVLDRVVATLALGRGADAPAGEQPLAEQVLDEGGCLLLNIPPCLPYGQLHIAR
jgi:hypothetical protein